ncbi:hypothetical protein DPEC_G00380080 [Dallia pectoralis]|nr:hypothetical protein DPEC_G00380080 [Dallia pectoralis]
MPNPTEQQWAPRGNTRAQFNDNRRDPEGRTVPILGGGDISDHQQRNVGGRAGTRGTYPEDKGGGSGPIGTHPRQISPPVLTRNSRLKPVAYLDLLKPRITSGNVTAEHPPASIAKMADQLMAAIKPSFPYNITMTLIEGETLDKYDLSCRRRWSTRSEPRDTPQPRLEERRQMVSTQTMTEDEPPPPVPEVRNYKQTIMVEYILLPEERWTLCCC